LSSGLIGLSILTGGNAFQTIGTVQTDTAAVVAAKAQFTTPATVAPWTQPVDDSIPDSTMASIIKGMDTIIDPPNDEESAGSDDVETSFIAYKALDRLRILAEAASDPTASDTDRTSLQKAFSKGLSDLQDFLANAPSDLTDLVFGTPSSMVNGAGIMPTQDISSIPAKGVVSDQPKDPNFSPSAIKGNEVLAIDLGKGKDRVNVDLRKAGSPPTAAGIQKAINDAIAAVPQKDASGHPVLDGDGNPVSRYKASYSVADNGDGTFGLTLNAAGDAVSLDQAPTPGYTLPIPGVTGNEVLKVHLSKGGKTQADVRLDLSTIDPQPPTLQSIADALNTQIKALGNAKNADGSPILDNKGNPLPLYSSEFRPTRDANGAYGLSVDAGATYVTMTQEASNDALVVVNSQTQYDTPGGARVTRVTQGDDGLDIQYLGSVTATDRKATADATKKEQDREDAAEDSDDVTLSTDTTQVNAALNAQSSVTDADGNTYIIGTTPGDLGTHRSDGGDDLFVAKVDSEGNIVWQQTLGVAGEAQGAAISLAPDGGVVIAGSVTGEFDGNLGTTGSDMLVARFDASGTKQFATSIPSPGEDVATAVAIDPTDGSIYLGGKADAEHGGKAYLAHLDPTGKMIKQQAIDSVNADGSSKNTTDTVNALAFDNNGNLLALTREDSSEAKLRQIDPDNLSTTTTVSLGAADARAIAVGPDGTIVVAGATQSAVGFGTQANSYGGGRDGFVTQFGSDLSTAVTTYIHSTSTTQTDTDGDGVKETVTTNADDQIDSVTFMNGQVYVGGRTTGDLGAKRKGDVDGFVSSIDASGAIGETTQFGSVGTTSDAVHVTTSTGGDNILGSLGLKNGELNAEVSTTLASQLGLDENDVSTFTDTAGVKHTDVLANGDAFSIQLDNGEVQKITIDPGETATSLSLKVQQLTGSAARVSTGIDADGNQTIGFSVTEGHTLSLVSGPDGHDALAKLGVAPTKLHSAPPKPDNAPAVTPGGEFGLALSTDLTLGTQVDAKAALDAITSAISMTQSAYRSLYWDDGKAALVNGTPGPGSAEQQKQLANYQAALSRLSTAPPSANFALL
jgi:hypothetical protein